MISQAKHTHMIAPNRLWTPNHTKLFPQCIAMPIPIILYDIPSKNEGKLKPWSPNTWKVRCVLTSPS